EVELRGILDCRVVDAGDRGLCGVIGTHFADDLLAAEDELRTALTALDRHPAHRRPLIDGELIAVAVLLQRREPFLADAGLTRRWPRLVTEHVEVDVHILAERRRPAVGWVVEHF